MKNKMSDRAMNNISTKFFQKNYQIKDKNGTHIANVFFSETDFPGGPLGTLYTIHGYGGSPMEFCLKTPTDLALRNGLNVVAIEIIKLSATDGSGKNLSEMTLENLRTGIFHAVYDCKLNKKIPKTIFNGVFAHSMGARALCDLSMSSEFIKNYFTEHYVLNPFFMTPKRVIEASQKTSIWARLSKIQNMETRVIDGIEYKVPACLLNYCIELPKQIRKMKIDAEKITEVVSYSLGKTSKRIGFILGADDLPEYDNFTTNKNLYDGLKIEKKELYVIPGADHYFENKQSSYFKTISEIITKMRDTQLKHR